MSFNCKNFLEIYYCKEKKRTIQYKDFLFLCQGIFCTSYSHNPSFAPGADNPCYATVSNARKLYKLQYNSFHYLRHK